MNGADMSQAVIADAEASKSPDARRRKRELERELMELKMQIAQVEEKKKHIGAVENPRPEGRSQFPPDGPSDSDGAAKKPRPGAPAFKPRLMLTKTSAANRVWGAPSGRASPGLPSGNTAERPTLAEPVAPQAAAIPRPSSVEPLVSPVTAAPSPLSREVSPFSEGVPGGAEEGDGQGPPKRKRYPATKGTEVGRPNWLPEGWRVEEKVRGTGATAGTKDKYYFSPEGKRFRSRTEIQRFIESGALPAVSRKKKDGDLSAPNSRPGTPGASQLAKRPFDASPEEIQRLLSGAAAGPPNQPAMPKIPSRQKHVGAGSIALGIPPLVSALNPQFDPRLGGLAQGFPGQWSVPGGPRKEAPLWQQPLLYPPGGMAQPRPSPLAPHSGLDPFGRGGASSPWQGPHASQPFGIGVPELVDQRRHPVKQKVKKVKVPRRRLVVADRFHLESLGKKLVKERLASLLQEGIRQRQEQKQGVHLGPLQHADSTDRAIGVK